MQQTIGTDRPDRDKGAASAGGSDAATMIAAAEALVPVLRERAAEAERLGRLPDETVEDLERAGIPRATAPREFGGVQMSAEDRVLMLEQLARGCASTAFVAMIYCGLPWVLTKYSDEAQDEVYASDNAKLCGQITPSGNATAVDGGYRLTGKWFFSSGHHHAGWVHCPAVVAGDGDVPDLANFLVQQSAFTVADDWHVSGLCATGSNTISVEDVFVPTHRVLPAVDLESGLSTRFGDDPYYQMPLIPFFFSEAAGTPLGLASAALEIFKERVQKRGITYTPYTRQADAAVTHFQMDEATMKLDQARFHVQRAIDTSHSLPEGPDSVAQRVRVRSDIGWCMRLCKEVVTIVQVASGAGGLNSRQPLQRIVRDMDAISLHALFLFETNAEVNGRVLCGLEPGTEIY